MNEMTKNAGVETLKNAGQQIKRLYGADLRVNISMDEVRKMEEQSEVFAEYTREGMSKEKLKERLLPMIQYFLENIKLDAISRSMTVVFIVKMQFPTFDLMSVTPEKIFDYLDSKGIFEDLLTPESRKKSAFSKACQMVIEKGNVTLKTAVKRVIEDAQKPDYEERNLEEAKASIDQILEIINPIIDFYLEHESEIVIELFSKNK